MALTASGQAYRFLIEFCPTFDGVDSACLAELAVARGYEGVTAELVTAAIADLQKKLRLESFARGVGGEIGNCVLNSVRSQLTDKEICYFILGQSGEPYHPLQVEMVRDRADKLA
ncbi:MAG: hypothetical protein C0478_16405 [Planctomyces sp.]|nr:hypothetical protein [Planctomyces sp.]